jgi:hypothetical protein
MTRITDADRQAAHDLRVILADICGFWHPVGDESPLCVALAEHRRAAEQRLADKLVPLFSASAAPIAPTADVTSEAKRRDRAATLRRTDEVKLSA